MPEAIPEDIPSADDTPPLAEAPASPPELETPPLDSGMPQSAETESIPESAKEHAPMIEIHAPHESVHSWKDVFIHIAIIVVGLLIAVGLDNTVEFIHHRYQIAETRKALRIERRININHFAMETEEFHRFVPKLQTGLAIFQYLKAHPHAPPDQWPGKLSGYHLLSRYTDAAWKTAQQNNVLALMPDREVQQDDQLYRQLTGLSDIMAAKEEAHYEIIKIGIEAPNPSQMSPKQIDREILSYSNELALYGRGAVYQRVLSSHFPDFKPATTYKDEQSVFGTGGNSADDIRKLDEMVDRLRRGDEAAAHDGGQSGQP
ncbi:MAG TPA: hypothetical protein VII58_11330 [Acidobacteriaceae bacterium]